MKERKNEQLKTCKRLFIAGMVFLVIGIILNIIFVIDNAPILFKGGGFSEAIELVLSIIFIFMPSIILMLISLILNIFAFVIDKEKNKKYLISLLLSMVFIISFGIEFLFLWLHP